MVAQPVPPRWKAWFLACRPKTLPAALAPVLMGSAAAYRDEAFDAPAAILALICALLIQITTNFANDYFDFKKGADTAERIGPRRAVQSGWISPSTMLRATLLLIGITFLLGLILVAKAGLPILLIGLASLVCAVAYTAGPFPLAYRGLGDLFVFLFFGLAAVNGTYYAQALRWSPTALYASLPAGFLSTAILVINNFRDIDTDAKVGKRTLAVRLGRTGTRVEFAFLLLAAFVVPAWQVFVGGYPLWLLMALAPLPLTLTPLALIFTTTDGILLNQGLARTGGLLAIYALAYSAGLVLG